MYFLEETILLPGEKIRRIRGYLGLKQSQITGGRVTRNLISYIENGKVKLVRETAEIITENILKHASEKNMPIEITAEYLMWDEKEQAKHLLERYLLDLKDNIHRDKRFNMGLERAKEILEFWEIRNKKAELDEVLGDYLYEKKEFIKGNIYYIKAIENYIKEKNNFKVAEVYVKLGNNKILMEDYQEGIYYNDHAKLLLYENGIEDEALYSRILYSNALAYNHLGRYDKALENLKNLEKESRNLRQSKVLDILLLKASIYCSEEDYGAAKEVYEKIIEESHKDQLNIKALAYFKLGDLWLEKYGKITVAMEYLQEAVKIQLEIKDYDLANTYLVLGRCYGAVNDYENESIFLIKALAEANRWENHRSLIHIYKEILEFYIRNDRERAVDDLLVEIKGLIDREVYNREEINDLLIKVTCYYLSKNNQKVSLY